MSASPETPSAATRAGSPASAVLAEGKAIFRRAAQQVLTGGLKWGLIGLIAGVLASILLSLAVESTSPWTWGRPRGMALFVLHFLMYPAAFLYVGVARGVGHTARFIAFERGWAQAILARLFESVQSRLERDVTEPLPETQLREALREAFAATAENEGAQIPGHPFARLIRSFLMRKIHMVVVAALLAVSARDRDISIEELRTTAAQLLDRLLGGAIHKLILMHSLLPLAGVAVVSIVIGKAL